MTGAISLGAGAVLALAGLTVLLQGGALLASHYVPLWGAFTAVGGGGLFIGVLEAVASPFPEVSAFRSATPFVVAGLALLLRDIIACVVLRTDAVRLAAGQDFAS